MALKTCLAAIGTLLSLAALGCNDGYFYSEPTYWGEVRKESVLRGLKIDPKLEDRIFALDPDHVTEKDIKEVLSKCPAPRVINVHGGVYPVYLEMESFSRFMVAMGYPEHKVRAPSGGEYSYTCYGSSERLAGTVAWYYEREGMRPILVGHSQGGMHVVKALHELAGSYDDNIPVYNPLTDSTEARCMIVDPLTGDVKPVVGGVQVCYATAVGAGGLTRFLPNQWSTFGRLRRIPDSVAEFTGFCIPGDVLGGDFAGLGDIIGYHALGKAKVRTVYLPMDYNHYFVPRTAHLAESKETRDFINNYRQSDLPSLTQTFAVPSMNILWAADVWTSIKRNWVLELQRVIRAKRALGPARRTLY